ncbi:MAG: NAD(P)H-dependent oxidoreductase [Pseudomonadota bacterium]
MKALIVFSHPERNSFNGALVRLATSTLEDQGYDVTTTDLYAEGFDPVEAAEHYPLRARTDEFSVLREQRYSYENDLLPPDIKRQIALLEEADFVFFQFPIWWHGIPAMMKGWIDRVFVSGGLYTSEKRYDQGHFKGKIAVCSATIGAPAEAMQVGGRGGAVEQIFWPIQYSLHYMGFSVLPPFLANSIQGHGYSTDDDATNQRRLEGHKQVLIQRLRQINETKPICYPTWKDWDERGAAILP